MSTEVRRVHLYWLTAPLIVFSMLFVLSIAANIYSAWDMAYLSKAADACMLDELDRRVTVARELLEARP